MTHMDKKDILYIAVRAALEAGKRILDIYEDPSSDFGIERKADNSPLTVADKASHAVIQSFLSLTPYPVLSEEGRLTDYAERKGWTTLWVVDPLDGTKEFIKKNGEFTVNIALVEKGVPVAGVIYVPVKKDLFFALEGWGAYKLPGICGAPEGGSVDVLAKEACRLPLQKANREAFVVVASRSHLTPETEQYIRGLERQHPRVQTASSGSSLKICLVAEGSADVYPRFAPTMEWDTAAGHAIAHAAGKEMRNALTGEPLVYNKEDLLNPWFIVE